MRPDPQIGHGDLPGPTGILAIRLAKSLTAFR